MKATDLQLAIKELRLMVAEVVKEGLTEAEVRREVERELNAQRGKR